MSSEFQARTEVERVTLNAFADIKVVDPARAKIEMALTQLRGVGHDGADAESPPDKTVEGVRRSAFIVRDLLNPAFDKADAEAALEAFHRQHFQVGQNTVLKLGSGILGVELHL